MPFPMRIQPLDHEAYGESEPMKPRSRLKRLFDRKPVQAEFIEPSSVCLNNMVNNFIEQLSTDVKCGRSRCNCFNGYGNGSSDDDELDFGLLLDSDSVDLLKSLIPCASVWERNLLADTSKIVEKNKCCKRKDDLRQIVTEALLVLKYDASICKSRWEKTPSYPAGEYEYIDVIAEGGERVMIDVDFRSEFEVARSTGGYKSILQSLPSIFVGKPDRLRQIIAITSEAATRSLKKKGMHIAPWRKVEYMSAKWLSPYSRRNIQNVKVFPKPPSKAMMQAECGEFELVFGKETLSLEQNIEKNFPKKEWELPAVKPKRSERGGRAITGLAFLLREKP